MFEFFQKQIAKRKYNKINARIDRLETLIKKLKADLDNVETMLSDVARKGLKVIESVGRPDLTARIDILEGQILGIQRALTKLAKK